LCLLISGIRYQAKALYREGITMPDFSYTTLKTP
jgi:hypothetical protein